MLRQLAKAEDSSGVQARAALAAAGDPGVVSALNVQLKSPNAEYRKLAARGLLRLGRYPDLATALGDESPDVRTAVACNVLAFRD
jgi:HEAT repeat protein